MYDASSITDTESLSTGASVASILGIKGDLRTRHHPISQKPHAVLRRVESSENASDDGQGNNVVYFRLFAAKHINLKPGKELLLTLASADGRYKDQIVMFAGTLRGPDEDSDHEGTTQVEEEPQVIEEEEEEEEEEMIPEAVMPPKMRRQWTKRVEEVSQVIFKMPVAHSSVGVQAQPVYASSSVQAIAVQNSVSVQAQPSTSFASIQTSTSHSSTAVQADPPPPIASIYTSMDVQTDPVELAGVRQATNERFEYPPNPSPMQLSSPKSTSTMIPPLSVEIPGSCEPSEDMEMSPKEDIEETTQIHSDSSVEEIPHPPVLAYSSPPSRPTVTDMFDLDDSPDPKPSLHNPFVSGGFVIDFIGAVPLAVKEATRMEESEKPINHIDGILPESSAAEPRPLPLDSETPPRKAQSGPRQRRFVKRAKSRAERDAAAGPLSTNVEAAAESGVGAASSETDVHRDESALTPQLLVQSSVLPTPALRRFQPSARNAVASSSKTPLPDHAPLPSTSAIILPRAVTSNRAKEKSPVPAEKRQPQDYIDLTTPPPSPPPPQPKALAHIPAGPSSNPLGIRPSHSSLHPTPARPPTSYTTSAPKAKKPLVVGRGWPFVRAVNPTPIASARPAGSSKASKPQLDSVVGYSSPSPSPPPNSPISSVNKWKRIDSEMAIAVQSNDESLVDMVISEPPSPISAPPPLPPSTSASASRSKPHQISSDVHDQVMSLEEARIDGVSLLSRISPYTGEVDAREEQPTPSLVVPPASSSQKTSPSLLSRIDPPQQRRTQSLGVLSARSSQNAPATSQINSVGNPPTQQEMLSPVITPPSSAPSFQTSPVVNVNSGNLRRNSQSVDVPPETSSRINSTTPAIPKGPRRHRLEQHPTQTADVPSEISTRVNSATPAIPQGPRHRPKTMSIQLPTHHPLPPKPSVAVPPSNPLSFGASLLFGAPLGPRGTKRDCPSPDLWTAPGIVRVQSQRRTQQRWPTVPWTECETLLGEGDLAIRGIVFNSDGSCFALSCMDKTLRIWNSRTRLEIARLTHNSQVIGLAWLEGDAAVMSFGEDGVLGKWTRIGQQNQWQWARVITVDAEECAPGDTVCLACARDRIAIAFPQTGVKVWIWCKGSWLAHRSIVRKNVTALKFIDGGDALLGGTREGVVWHCAVPNGTMKVYAFLQSSITSIAVNPPGLQALVTQAGGSACLVKLGAQDEKRVAQSFLEADLHDGSVGAIFSTQGKTVVFGAVDGSLLVWDAQQGAILYGMEHPDGDMIQTVASSDGAVVAGTQQGQLLWWPEPQASPPAQGPSHSSRKRPKVK